MLRGYLYRPDPNGLGLKLAKLETEMKTLTTERDDIVQWLATEEAYLEDNKPRLQEMLKRQGEVVTLLADVEWKWFDVQQKLEVAG